MRRLTLVRACNNDFIIIIIINFAFKCVLLKLRVFVVVNISYPMCAVLSFQKSRQIRCARREMPLSFSCISLYRHPLPGL